MTNYSRKLTENEATDLRHHYWAGGQSQAELARRFGISASQVWQIVHRRLWPFGQRVQKEPPT